MRQYEYEDCDEAAVTGGNYSTITFSSCRGLLNSADLVIGFGNQETQKVVWVPFGSKIKIADVDYTVVEGEYFSGRRDCGEIFRHFDRSGLSLIDPERGKHSLYDLLNQKAEIITMGSGGSYEGLNLAEKLERFKYRRGLKAQDFRCNRKYLRNQGHSVLTSYLLSAFK